MNSNLINHRLFNQILIIIIKLIIISSIVTYVQCVSTNEHVVSIFNENIYSNVSTTTTTTTTSSSITKLTKNDKSIKQKNINNGLLYSFTTDKFKMDSSIIDLPVMKWFGKLLDHHDWTEQYLEDTNPACHQDIVTYLTNLKNGTTWAIKMNDASGRYNGQFFFGNDFWLGSKSLCYELQNEYYNLFIPPFEAHFYMTKLRMHLNEITPNARFISLGLCLPKACSVKDIRSILQKHIIESTSLLTSTSLELLSVRPVPGEFNPYDHVSFYIAVISTIIVTILVLTSSCYEWLLNRRIAVIKLQQKYTINIENNTENNNNIQATGADNNNGTTIQTNNNNNNNTINLVLMKKQHKQTASSEHRISMVHQQHYPATTNHNNGNGIAGVSNSMSTNGNANSNNINNNSAAENLNNKTLGQGFLSQLLLCFSAISNGKKILSFEKPSGDAITCIHGLRFLSLCWVIMVHTYLSVFQHATNKTLRSITERFFLFQTISNATFSVDTFFFISGLLLSILYYRSEEKKQQKKNEKLSTIKNDNNNIVSGNIPSTTTINGTTIINPSTAAATLITDSQLEKVPTFAQILHTNTLKFFTLLFYRFIRLTPVYMFILTINDIIIKWGANNSVFDYAIIYDINNCDQYWWRNLVYVNNLYPLSEMCMIWSWYMANDTQFYVIGIILLLVSLRSMKLAIGMLLTFMVSAWITTYAIANYFNYHARIEAPFDLFNELYEKPWTRLGPYLIGMITGWILFKINVKMQIPRIVAVLCWILSLGCLASLVYGLGSTGLRTPYSSLYVSLGHTAWAICLAWITVACSTGYGGPINALLSFRGMLPLSRLTYCAYLIHPIILSLSGNQRDGPVHLHNLSVFVIVCGNAVTSFLCSLVVSLAFEAPIVRLLHLIVDGPKPKQV